MKQKNFYQDLLVELNSIYKNRCIEFSVRDHQFPCWDSSVEEDISEMDHINYRWEVIKERVGIVNPQPRNICQPACRKFIENYFFHDSCELVDFLKLLIKIK